MKALDRKLLRDLLRLWAQVAAIALVMAAGVMTLVLAVGAQRSLFETREAYYERNAFADIFATATRAPNRLGDEIAALPGVASVETRITQNAILDIEGMAEPASGMLVSVPDDGEQVLNRLYLRLGRLPAPGHPDEVVVNEPFANAHGFVPGDTFGAVINGRKRDLTIVGVALSPEFIYVVTDLMPDDRRLGLVWMSQTALSAAFDLDGAFNAISVKLLRGQSPDVVIDEIDRLLEPYGGRGAHDREDQQSHAFLDSELNQLQAMSYVLPPIFLLVAGFLVNMILSRLIALEREQIGLMKAVGYTGAAVAWHYLKLVIVIALLGVLVGASAGTLLGRGLTRLYGDFFHFPFLIFRAGVDIYLIAIVVSVSAAMLGALRSVRAAAALPPAVAMRPPAPARYRQLLPDGVPLLSLLPQTTVMIGRNIVRRPLRALFTSFGMSLSVAMLVGTLFALDSVDEMIDVTFFGAERQHATLSFVHKLPAEALYEAERLPGVLAAEPARMVAARFRNGHLERRLAITGKPGDSTLSRLLDVEGHEVTMPDEGVVLTTALAGILDVGRGDTVEVELMEEHRETVLLPVSAVVESYIGLGAYMDMDALNRLMREAPSISAVHVIADASRIDELYDAVKNLPLVGSITLQRAAVEKFRETMAENLIMMVTIYVGLAGIIAFGVVYNGARIQLSEQGRELASLRVLGFTRGEVSWILLGEFALLTLLALPMGWLLGYLMAYSTAEGLATELFRLPLVIQRSTYGWASVVVLVASALSALIVRRRIDRLDLIEVLKTRE
ncbi:ABC transporter permease [Mesorhizobium microcysteis]|uniref:ABC transporter permease n=1 Tax=Neoaquamicrobium microcysteis TaxID=2682781 RepID=A0A5D4GP01_9HYPH|nr:ABC transporter permease [Mesorhizobium microcysteis]TYR29683.1 ABC transporter permease [Mesorhizobium microcysteis]